MSWEKLKEVQIEQHSKNPKISLRIRKNLEVQPRTNIHKSPNIESIDELEKLLS